MPDGSLISDLGYHMAYGNLVVPYVFFDTNGFNKGPNRIGYDQFFYHNEGEIEPLFGMVCPLLLKADGEKMGKTANGTLWVSRNKTTVFDFFQEWINCFDEDVERSLAFFTRMDMDEIKELCSKDIRHAKKVLAFEVTKLVHGKEEALKAVKTSEELFGGNGTSDNMPIKEIKASDNISLIDLLVLSEITQSKSEARRLIMQNGISINGKKENNIDKIIDVKCEQLTIQKGKKMFVKIKFI